MANNLIERLTSEFLKTRDAAGDSEQRVVQQEQIKLLTKLVESRP